MESGTVVDSLEDEIASLAAHLDAAQHRLLVLIRTLDDSGEWFGPGCRSCAAWLTWRIGLAPAAARDKVRIAHALVELPLIDAALAQGVISYSKVRALTRVATPRNEQALLTMAQNATAAQLEKICRGVRRVVREDEGLEDDVDRDVSVRMPAGSGDAISDTVRLQATLHPDEASRVMQAIACAREALHEEEVLQQGAPREGAIDGYCGAEHAYGPGAYDGEVPRQSDSAEFAQPSPVDVALPSRVDALLHLAEFYLAHQKLETSQRRTVSGGDRYELVLHLGPSVLSDHHDAFLDDGTRISGEVLRRIACDAGLVPVATDERGAPLDVGRKTRSIPPAIRRALHVRDRGACVFPGCTHTRFLDAHHVHHWADGGTTRLDNLVLLCSRHHTLLHEGGYRIERAGKRGVLFRTPTGERIPSVPRPAAVSSKPAAALKEQHEQLGLQIGAHTNALEGYTHRPNYSLCVAAAVP